MSQAVEQEELEYAERVLALLRELGAVRAVAAFSGGNDQGGIDSLILTLADGGERQIEFQYDRQWVYDGTSWQTRMVALTPEQLANNALWELMDQPIDGRYGSFAGNYSVEGEVVADVEEGTVVIKGEEEVREYESFEEEL